MIATVGDGAALGLFLLGVLAGVLGCLLAGEAHDERGARQEEERASAARRERDRVALAKAIAEHRPMTEEEAAERLSHSVAADLRLTVAHRPVWVSWFDREPVQLSDSRFEEVAGVSADTVRQALQR